jgi:hypothetical protein
MTLTESDIEEAALSRPSSLGYTVTPGPDIASREPAALHRSPPPKVISCDNVKNPLETKT